MVTREGMHFSQSKNALLLNLNEELNQKVNNNNNNNSSNSLVFGRWPQTKIICVQSGGWLQYLQVSK